MQAATDMMCLLSGGKGQVHIMIKKLTAVLLSVALILGCAGEAQAAKYKPKRYDPDKVVAKAMKLCIKGGMISTADNLDDLLEEGRITQEEYDDYYPTDGLGYYSVFVNTDLKKATTIGGRRLKSVNAIAKHIAGMLLLEKEPYFYIEYTGKTKYAGNTFYEFRCYR